MITNRNFTFIAGALASLLSITAIAEEAASTLVVENYSCKFGDTAGLHYESNGWEARQFKTPKDFYLTLKHDKDAYALIFKDGTTDHACRDNPNLPLLEKHMGKIGEANFMCITGFGVALVFSHKELRGTIAYMGGATQTGKERDDLVIHPFMCVKVK
jgi:hypothetical protein